MRSSRPGRSTSTGGNRLGTVYTWAGALYLSKNRGHRIISFQTTGYEFAGQRSFARSIQPYPTPDSQDTPAAITEQPEDSH